MNSIAITFALIGAFSAGVLLAWVLVRAHWKVRYDVLDQKNQEQGAFVANSEKALREAFGSLAAEALNRNNQAFVHQAKGVFDSKEREIDNMVKPLKESLDKMDSKIQQLEVKREGAYEGLKTVIDQMQKTTNSLDKGTQNLVNALKSSSTRGKYGEIGLRRVVEFAGMSAHCDFEEQVSVSGEQGSLRPDMIIRLPEGKNIVVDSKVPLDAYMKVFETENEAEQQVLLRQHAQAVRQHLTRLSAKQYWDQFPGSPDYVILYLQIESSFGAALQADPSLIQAGIQNKVILATPTTLITLLRTIAFVWQQRHVTDNIEEIRKAGLELYARTNTLLTHFSNIGGGLTMVVNHFNKAVASLESRFIPQARRLQALGPAYAKEDLPEVGPIDQAVREIAADGEEET
jgi:DNA recombination protein RmuC